MTNNANNDLSSPLLGHQYPHTSETSETSPVTTPVKDQQVHQLETKQKDEFGPKLIGVLTTPTQHTNLDKLGKEVMALAEQQCPEMTKAMDDLHKKYKDQIKGIKEKGWEILKQEKGPKMKTEFHQQGESYEAFREEAYRANLTLDDAILRQMGCKDPGTNRATGTGGWASDVDTVRYAPEMNHEMQTVGKLLFDITWFTKFDGLSGTQIDTESYVEHSGDTLETQKKMTSDEARRGFNYLETSLAHLQMLRACYSNPQEWEAHKRRHLMTAQSGVSPDYHKALNKIFDDVAAFQASVEKDIKLQAIREAGKYHVDMEPKPKEENEENIEKANRLIEIAIKEILEKDPEALKKAELTYKIPRLIKISQKMDRDQIKLNMIYEKIKKKKESLFYKLKNLVTTDEELLALEKEAEKIELRLATRAAIRNTFFPESYWTQGAYNKTCMLNKGQIHQRENERALSIIATQRESDKKVKEGGEIRDFQILPINFKLKPKQKLKATVQENFSSLQENLSMHRGHFVHKAEHYGKVKALVDTSKYSMRAMEASHELLQALKNKPGVWESVGFIEKEELEDNDYLLMVTRELEKCKRKAFLNFTATNQLLLNHGMSQKQIEDIKPLLMRGEPGGDLAEESTLLPEDRLLVIMKYLADKGYIEVDDRELAVKDNPELTAILKARCGYPIIQIKEDGTEEVDSLINSCFEEGTKITLSKLGLDNDLGVAKFNKKLLNHNQILQNLCLKHALVAIPLTSKDQDQEWDHFLSLKYLWDETRY